MNGFVYSYLIHTMMQLTVYSSVNSNVANLKTTGLLKPVRYILMDSKF